VGVDVGDRDGVELGGGDFVGAALGFIVT